MHDPRTLSTLIFPRTWQQSPSPLNCSKRRKKVISGKVDVDGSIIITSRRGMSVLRAAPGWRCRSRPGEGPVRSEATKEGARG